MYTVGLTGGVGAGKSVVSAYFSSLGVVVVDADIIAREVILQPAIKAQIVNYFGHALLQSSGELDRAALREEIFANTTSREWLNTLLHPLIRKQMLIARANARSAYCLLVIPLLVESSFTWSLDRVLLVEADQEQRISRICQRDQLSQAQAKKMIEAQASEAQRLAIADDIVYNNGQLNTLMQQIECLHAQYLAACGADGSIIPNIS